MGLCAVVCNVRCLDLLPHRLYMAELLQDSGGVSGICQRTMLRPLEIDLHRPQRTGEIHGTGEPVEPLVDPLEIHSVGIEHFVQRLLFQIRLFQQNALV